MCNGSESNMFFGLILDSVVCWFHNSEFLYTLNNLQKMHYEVSNNFNNIHVNHNLCGCIPSAAIVGLNQIQLYAVSNLQKKYYKCQIILTIYTQIKIFVGVYNRPQLFTTYERWLE